MVSEWRGRPKLVVNTEVSKNGDIRKRASIESYGISYKNFFSKSEYAAFSALGRLMHVGVDVREGLIDALTMKRAHLGSLQYLQLLVAQYFTRIDGTSSIYIGRESIIPATSAWPIPHDAPFKIQLDRKIMAITEAGLYEQWRKEMLLDAERDSRIKQRKLLMKQHRKIEEDVETDGLSATVRALTFTHIQGPLILLLVGFFLGGSSLLTEKISASL
ncbi:uncharacterized protein LOC135113845 [Scylla paramamosain]|uniref:uncharacterized protein LOC135113845 n=1 Tax=Scylla paramamosain TaxID=85552 RepID=UPI003083D5D4